MSERETKVIKLPCGKELTLKAWLSAREVNALRETVFGGVKIETTSEVGPGGAIVKTPKLGEIDPTIAGRLEKLLIEQAVLTFDGSADNILERLLDERMSDFQAAVNAANVIAGFADPTAGK